MSEDASSNMPRKRRKTSKHDEKDRMSNLPLCIMDQILSHLSTKDALRTCILSKSWLCLWKSFTTLHLDDRELRRRRSNKKIMNKARKKKIHKVFQDFVSTILAGLTNSTIQSFSLNLADKYNSCLVNDWILSVLDRRTRNLVVHHPEKLAFLHTRSIFSCDSLVQLVLDIDCTVRFPSSVHLPNLEALELSRLEFTNPSSALNASAILMFPDRLDIDACRILIQFKLVKYLKLGRLEVSNYDGLPEQALANLPVFNKLEHLQLGFVYCNLLMHFLRKTPNLTILETQGILKFDKELLDSAIVPVCFKTSLKVILIQEGFQFS
ncbi:F-box/FBD/LRR-repeat protein [Senna tora]|uniref:F-box/FBD/LRR-repeat protein n=1 Tax=Senna tora TaxID=362788 RepID=A0A834WIP3_9FABA|nr:F-box/FBD/LRR-repeat protein [Senna tora]